MTLDLKITSRMFARHYDVNDVNKSVNACDVRPPESPEDILS